MEIQEVGPRRLQLGLCKRYGGRNSDHLTSLLRLYSWEARLHYPYDIRRGKHGYMPADLPKDMTVISYPHNRLWITWGLCVKPLVSGPKIFSRPVDGSNRGWGFGKNLFAKKIWQRSLPSQIANNRLSFSCGTTS